MKARAKPLLIALGMAAALAVAVPVQAQPSTAFGLQFGFGPGQQSSDTPAPRNGPDRERSGSDRQRPGQGLDIFGGGTQPLLRPAPQRLIMCLTPSQIRDAIADRGYTDIALNALGDSNVEVRATRDGNVYLLDYNFCTDDIESEALLR